MDFEADGDEVWHGGMCDEDHSEPMRLRQAPIRHGFFSERAPDLNRAIAASAGHGILMDLDFMRNSGNVGLPSGGFEGLILSG